MVEAVLVGDPEEDVVSDDVASDAVRVVPGLVALEVRLLPPVDVGTALVVE